MLDRLSDCMLYQFVGAIMLSLCIERYQWIHSVKKILFFLVDLCDQEFFSIFTYPVLFSCKWFEQNVHLTILLKKKTIKTNCVLTKLHMVFSIVIIIWVFIFFYWPSKIKPFCVVTPLNNDTPSGAWF